MSKFNRREFGKLAVSLPMMPKLQETGKLDYAGGLTDIRGIRVGHFTDSRRPTGCTVVLIEKGAVAGVDVRGSAPGTRETDLLEPRNTVQKVHAVVLSGGSAFGLDSAAGVVQYLEEKGIGYPTRYGPVPIVPAAILYDLGVGNSSIRPDRQAGYRACRNATTGPIEEGNVGAGAGATVGKLLGAERGMKGGLGSASIRVGQLAVAALAAVNASGDVIDPASGRILAGARSKDGKSFADLAQILKKTPLSPVQNLGENTTLGVVATNASFDKAATQKVAQMSHDGLARAINPIHLPSDGDTIFSLSTGELDGSDLGQVGALAAEAITQAVVRAVLQARGIPGYPAHFDLK
ncbi:P1 family peptidase [Acidobacteria bacterium AH-259-G07]|nr:P1 family peptidase [Acidobacteria bacterium AH-259-G07]